MRGRLGTHFVQTARPLWHNYRNWWRFSAKLNQLSDKRLKATSRLVGTGVQFQTNDPSWRSFGKQACVRGSLWTCLSCGPSVTRIHFLTHWLLALAVRASVRGMMQLVLWGAGSGNICIYVFFQGIIILLMITTAARAANNDRDNK